METLQRLAYGTLLAGVMLFSIGWFYPDWAKSSDSRWSPADEEELEAARLKFHGLSFKYGEAIGTADEARMLAELNAAEEAWKKAGEKRDWAVDGPG